MTPPSIRIRLTAWYLVVIFASLAVYSVGMYFGLRQAIEKTVDRQLEARSANVGQLVKNVDSQRSGRKEDRREKEGEAADSAEHQARTPQLLPTGSLQPGDELYQVIDSSGSVLYQSPVMRDLEIPLNIRRMRNHYRHHRDDGKFTTYYHKGGDVRVLSSSVRAGNREYQVQVATVVSPLYAVLDSFRAWAWFGLPLIVSLASMGGYWLSGRAMEPVHDLTLSTLGISERNLSKRLPLPAAHDELRELAQTINIMLGRLESAFTRIARFTADASHELRTPIAVIRTTSEVILDKDRSAEEYKKLVGQILLESESMSALLDQLLTLARADADTAQLSFAPVDLCGMVEDLTSASQALADSRGIRWSSTTPPDRVEVLGDKLHLRRLLLILIENACRYTKSGGSVRLLLEVQGQEALLTVVDTGIGIPAAELPLIFDRFYRASNARYFAPDGTGLGLSIAHWIAAAHDSLLKTESSVDSGTSMRLSLKLCTTCNG